MVFRLIAQLLYSLLLFIETMVSIRFIFKLFGANPGNSIVQWLYWFTDLFIRPFQGIVEGNWNIGKFYIDLDALIALVVYMVLAFVILEIMRVFSPKPSDK